MTLATQAARGVLWLALRGVLGQVIQVASIVVLARLLTPRDFGVVAMATAAIGILGVLADLGLGSALVHRPELDEGTLALAFRATLAAGALLGLVTALAAPAVGRFFREPDAVAVLGVLALTLPAASLRTVPQALLARSLAFRELALVETAATGLAALTAVALALAGTGLWSLVLGVLVHAWGATLLGWVASRPARRTVGVTASPLTGASAPADLLRFGRSVTGSALLNAVAAHVDDLVVGRVLGTAALGTYQVAYGLATFPQRHISPVLSRVAFPVLSRARPDPDRLRRGYLQLVTLAGLGAMPLLVALAALAPALVAVVYGPAWSGVIGPLRILAPLGILYALVSTVGTVFLATGRPGIELLWQVATLVSLAVAALVGVRYGLLGVAAALLLRGLVMLPVIQWIANRTAGLRAGDWARAVALPARGAAGVAIGTLPVALLEMAGVAVRPAAALAIGLGGAIAGLGIAWSGFRDPVLLELRGRVAAALRRDAGARTAP